MDPQIDTVTNNISKLIHTVAMVTALLGFVLGATQFANAQGGGARTTEGKKAEEVFKNIKVMNGTPADELVPAMHLIRGQLGVDCEYCHEEENRAADTKEAKTVARKMMQMMNDINKNSFAGEQEVTCYTCHRGSARPVGTLILPMAETEERPRVNLPSADQIVAKYVEALGGEQALRKVASRVVTGTQYIPTGPGGGMPVPATIEQYQKAPNMSVNIYHTATFTISNGFDGSRAWSQDQRGRVAEASGVEQARAQREADFYFPLDLKRQYTKMDVRRIVRVNDRDAYLVIGTPQNDLPEQLYFDTQTGLLLRKQTVTETPVGRNPFQVNYGDYRDTGSGVKFPFLITLYPASKESVPQTSATIHVTKVQDNAPIDNAKFMKPEPKAPAAQ